HLPLSVIWAIWLALLAAMMATWAGCAWSSRRASPPRAWLGMFALTAVMMLMASPIVWPHYFMWLLPATLFLTNRPRLLVGVALVGQLGMMVPTFRGLGVHTMIALCLFAMVARELLKERMPSPMR